MQSRTMTTPYVVSFVAHSGTGKTTLLEQVIPVLKQRSYRVGVIKHDAHRFEIDHPGKDSYRLTVAGADTMVICSGEKLALVRRHREAPTLAELLVLCDNDLDIILTEGFKQSPLPKIEVYRSSLGRPLLCRGAYHDPTLIAVASDGPLVVDVPLLDLNNPVQVADFIERNLKMTDTHSTAPAKSPLISIGQAIAQVLEQRFSAGSCRMPLSAAQGMVLAETPLAPFDLPPHEYAAMDGYGFAYASAQAGPITVNGFLPAGVLLDRSVAPGEAIRIMTGAPVPAGCDTVIPQEDCRVDGATLCLLKPYGVGDNIRRAGEDLRRGEPVLQAGVRLGPPEIALLSSINCTTVPVYRRVRVAILATGDELVEPGSERLPGAIFNSNSTGLAAMVVETGGEPIMMGIAADTPQATAAGITSCLSADVILVTGGASAGDHDYVKDTVIGLGGVMHFSGVNIKPGKPVGFGLVQGKPIFALPGNPVAALVTFELLVRPLLLAAMGSTQLFRPVMGASLTNRAKNKGKRPHLVGGMVSAGPEGITVTVTGSQSSGRVGALVKANGLVYLPEESAFQPGDHVDVLLVGQIVNDGNRLPWS